jgi:hypothetical protein
MKQKHLLPTLLLLLCFVVVLVYAPAFRAEPCLLDDVAMLKGLQGPAQLNLKELLTPGSTGILYSRPIIGVSYRLSQFLWDADPQAMHAENVVLHFFNVMLLFWLIRMSLPKNVSSGRYAPFLGALLFAVHPITTESVNWISGRTDLIAGAFLIGAAIALVTWQQHRKRWWMVPVALLLVAGAILTKEVSWGFLLILPLFLITPYDSHRHRLGDLFGVFSRIEKLLVVTAIALCFLLAAVLLSFWPVMLFSAILGLVVLYRKPRLQPLSLQLFLLISALLLTAAALIPYCAKLTQHASSAGTYSNLKRTVLLISVDPDNSIGIFSSALAFYLKKLFLPLPLSFAITDIAPKYLFAGIAVIILTAFLAVWRSQAAILFLSGIAMLLPTLPLVHNQIAWAPYAERYIYITSAFWIAAMAVSLGSLKSPFLRAVSAGICLLVIPIAASLSYMRSTVWQTNVALFGDTVQKSPHHVEARILFMKALLQTGRLSEAMEQYRRIQADPRSWLRVKYFNELAELLYKGGLKLDAWEVLDTSLAKPLPQGRKHPLRNDEWQRLYTFHDRLRRELFPLRTPLTENAVMPQASLFLSR